MAKRALLLISDTGGGHRSAANAIVAALEEPNTPHAFETRIEDVAAHCAFPLTQLGLGYSMALRYAPPVYGALYYATNGRRRYRALVRFCEPLYRERLRDLFISYQPC
jgi:1,2-diacylglycerol 3-beta-galactosyltransferase